jgi:very-long-chain (3R)-3-hydroxyacyl-CoA dehydratase
MIPISHYIVREIRDWITNMSGKNTYLLIYNALSFSLWTFILLLIPFIATYHPPSCLYNILFKPFLVPTQSLAVLEILHASLGLVRASPLTTALQVIGKNLVVWTVMMPFPELIKEMKLGLAGYTGCLVAWSMSEVVRFGYFSKLSWSGEVGDTIKWLRYSLLVESIEVRC